MSQSSSLGPLASIYQNRIGTATNENEIMGYWSFLIGVILGVLGLVVFFVTDPATTERGFGYALAALAPPLIVLGAVLRFPLRRMATYVAGIGTLISIIAVVWFLVIFPDGWSLTLGDTGVIVAYVAGLAITGLAGAIVPLVTDPRDVALAAKDAELADISANWAVELDELRSTKAHFELYKDDSDEWRWRLKHRNGNIIADSGESYTSKANAEKGLRSVKTNALGAETREV